LRSKTTGAWGIFPKQILRRRLNKPPQDLPILKNSFFQLGYPTALLAN